MVMFVSVITASATMKAHRIIAQTLLTKIVIATKEDYFPMTVTVILLFAALMLVNITILAQKLKRSVIIP